MNHYLNSIINDTFLNSKHKNIYLFKTIVYIILLISNLDRSSHSTMNNNCFFYNFWMI